MTNNIKMYCFILGMLNDESLSERTNKHIKTGFIRCVRMRLEPWLNHWEQLSARWSSGKTHRSISWLALLCKTDQRELFTCSDWSMSRSAAFRKTVTDHKYRRHNSLILWATSPGCSGTCGRAMVYPALRMLGSKTTSLKLRCTRRSTSFADSFALKLSSSSC